MITKKTPLKKILELVKDCRCAKCESGCRFGSGIFVQGEIRKAAKRLNLPEKEFKKKYLEQTEEFNKEFFRPKIKRGEMPYGPCIFFDDNKRCSIHDVKPMQCRLSMSCSDHGEEIMIWFMLNYIIDYNDPEALRQYSQYLASGGKTIKGGELKDIVKDNDKLKRILSYEILR